MWAVRRSEYAQKYRPQISSAINAIISEDETFALGLLKVMPSSPWDFEETKGAVVRWPETGFFVLFLLYYFCVIMTRPICVRLLQEVSCTDRRRPVY